MPTRRRRVGWWRGLALVASFGVHGLAVAALHLWPGALLVGEEAENLALTISFQQVQQLLLTPPPSDSEPPSPPPIPKEAPPPPPRRTTPPKLDVPEIPLIEVVMAVPPTPRLRFQPATEFVEASVEFPADEPESAPQPPPTPQPESDTPPKPAKPPASSPPRYVGKTVAARPLRTPSPAYPSSAAARKIEGTVVLTLSIDSNGKVSGVNMIQSSGNSALDRSAEQGVRHWRFAPALKNGAAVASRLRAPIAFRLD